ncbi:MAG: hypothetical protein M0P27_10710 [Bacteroidales bacterium]|nr:hypothetical protein [Bacteroidales bacterium]
MKKTSLIILLLCFPFISRAQDVVKWEIRCEKISGKTYEVRFTPKVQESWHIYSLGLSGGMNVPTSFSFEDNPLVILKGAVKEIGLQHDFVQKIKLKRGNAKILKERGTATILKGAITYMACNDEQCRPPQTVEFECEVGAKSTIPLKSNVNRK